MEDKDYTWEEVANALNELYSRITNSKQEFVNDCNNGFILGAMTQILALCYIYDIPRNDPDAIIILNGFDQLNKKGYIGEMVVDNS